MTHSAPDRTPTSLSPAARGFSFALIATVVWSFNFIAGRGLADAVEPCTLALGRWLVALIAVLPLALPEMIRKRHALRKHWRYYLCAGILGIAYFNTAIYWAAHTVPAINLSLIAASSPLFTILLARIWFAEGITPRRLAGIATALAGIVLLLTRGDITVLTGLSFHTGDLIMLSAAFSFALYTLMVRGKPDDCSQMAFFGVTFSIGVICLVPFAVWELSSTGLPEATPALLGGLLYMGLGASLFAFWCWGKAIGLIGPSKAAIIYYSLPLFCGIEAVLFLNEPLLWTHFASSALILGGLALATKGNS